MGAPAIQTVACAECGGPMPTPQVTGRRRVTCSERCRQRRTRRRRALPWPPIAPPSFPTDPETVRRRTAEAMVALLEGDVPAPPEDQLSQGLLELDWITYRLASLERDLPRRLAGPTGALARAVRDARHRCFPMLEGES